MPFELVARNGLIALNNSIVTGSLNVTNGITGSLFGTSSWTTQALTASSADAFNVRGTLTATTLVVQTITSSQNFITGSTRFGTIITNTHQFTGSVGVTGSITVVDGVTNNLTASWSNRAISASIADNAVTASRALNANTASHAAFAATATSATTATSVVATVTGTNSTELVRGNMADNDQFRILVGGTSTNAGFVEIATADDGTEPIHVRQYTGVFSSLTRTATLLDGSGNTSFPGNVGIGSTSPARKLDVNGTSVFRDFTSVFAGAGNVVSNITWLSTDSGIMNIYTGGSATVQLNSSGVSYFNGGSVGIGTTSPSRKLHIVGSEWDNTSGGGVIFENSNTVGASLTLKPSASTVTNGTSGWAVYAGGPGAAIGDGNMGFWAHGTNAAIFVIQRGGNVGIGTTSPVYKLDVVGTGRFTGGLLVNTGTQTQTIGSDGTYGSTYPMYSFTGTTNGSHRIFAGTADDMYFSAATSRGFEFRHNGGTSAAIKILSGGNIGIGTTSPAADGLTIRREGSDKRTLLQLDRPNNAGLQTNIRFTVADIMVGQIQHEYAASNYNHMSFTLRSPGGSDVIPLWLENSGNVGIGSTSPSYKLDVVGSVKAGTGNTTALLVAATAGGQSMSASIAIQQLTSEGDTIIFADYEPYAEYGIMAKNSVDSIDFIGGPSTGGLTSYSVKNRTGDIRTAYVKTRVSLADGNLYVGGSVGIGTTSPAYLLHVNGGDIGTSGFVHARYTSDETYKGTFNWAHLQLGNNGQNDIVAGRTATGGFFRFIVNNTNNWSYGTINGTIAMVIAANGNVGIGTTSPGQLLHVNGGQLLVNSGTSVAAYRDIMIGGIGGWSTGESHGIDTVYNTASSPTTFTRIESYFDGSSAAMYFRNFFNSSSPQTSILMTIRGNGNVGIGTTSPGSKLHVAGDARIVLTSGAGGDTLISAIAGVSNGYRILVDTSNNITYSWSTGANATAMTIASGGTVGIGTTSPASILNTSGAGQGITHDDSTTGRGYIRFRNGGSQLSLFGIAGAWEGSSLQDTMIAAETGLNIRFYTNGSATPKMYIKTDGNVGIGTTSPIGKQHNVIASNGTALFLNNSTGGTGAFVDLDFGTYTTAQPGYANAGATIRVIDDGDYSGHITFRAKGNSIGASQTERVRIQSNGNLGIGTTSPIQLLDVYQSTNGFSGINTRNPSAGTAAHSGLYIGNDAGTNSGGIIVFGSSSTYSSPYNPNGTYIYSNKSGGIAINSEASAPLYLATNNTIRLYITSGGNVGIGTTSPLQKLSVEGGNIILNGANASANYYLVLNKKTGQDGGILFNRDNNNDWQFTNTSTGNLLFYSYGSSTEAITFQKSSGNVGINTTSPGYRLEVIGNFRVSSTSILSSQVVIAGDTNSGGGVGVYDAYVDGSSSYLQYPPTLIRLDNGATGTIDQAPIALLIHNENGANNTWTKLSLGSREASGAGNTVSIAGIAAQKTSGTANSWASGDLHLWTKASSTQVTNMILKSNGNVLMNAGNVGIGTTSPGAKFNIVHDNGTINAGASAIRIDNNSGGQSTIYFVHSGNQRGSIRVDSTGNMILNSDSKNFYFNNDFGSSSTINFINTSTTFMSVNSGGNVGIGTTSPAYKLDVNGSTRTFGYLIGVDNSATIKYVFTNDGGASYINSGNVGIGTTSPSKKLHIRSGDNEGMFMEGSSTGGHWFDFKSANSNLWSMGAQPGIMGWYNRTDNSYKMVISDGGNVGIGTTAPDYKLRVAGNGYFSSTLEAAGNIWAYTGIQMFRQGTTATGISWYNNSYYNWQEYMASAGATSCGPNGNLTAPSGLSAVTSWALRSRMEGVSTYGWIWETSSGGGGDANASPKMELGATNGTLQVSGDMVAYASDGRLKTNVKEITNALDKVKAIRGVEYDWVDDIEEKYGFHPTSKHEVGVIAQEIQKVLPEAVLTAPFNGAYKQKYNEDPNFLTVKYERVVPLLIEAIKEQQQQIDELKYLLKNK